METIEDTQKKLCAGPLQEVQLNGLCILIQHPTRFSTQDRKRYPCIASWGRVDHGRRYDTTELVQDIKEEEVIPIMYPRDTKLVHPTVTQFMVTDEFGHYVDDGEGWLSVDERLRRAKDAYFLREQVGKLERRLGTTHNREGGEVGSGAEVGAIREGLCASIAPCVGDVSYRRRSGIRRWGVDGKQVADEVDRDVNDGLTGDNGDGENDLNGSVVNKNEFTHMASFDACNLRQTSTVVASLT
ncbi:hypothetical protein Cgig2_000568 [Carnegiea gigantea]|uniref:Uncharacterized protein n=1 Tax=Carnegiea gigantea TaxID=171969 RepID=A0A9Q1GUJ1_9CARY|nr:hypothetical protein Cgig2_032978 [Carnegiea gigantea]KAJ8426373.1 hypothetical protein Cgig2_000568 [Carnegiea gigantea]